MSIFPLFADRDFYKSYHMQFLILLFFCTQFVFNSYVFCAEVESTDDINTSALISRFIDPPATYRAKPILHSYPLDTDSMEWLRQRHAGGTVLEVGVTPGSQNLDGQSCNNPTYLNDPQRFTKLKSQLEQMHAAGFKTWIYDELGYPSGNAGGLVLAEHPEYQAQLVGAQLLRCHRGETLEMVPKQGTLVACFALPIVIDRGEQKNGEQKSAYIPNYNPSFNGVEVSLEAGKDLTNTADSEHRIRFTAPDDTDYVLCLLERYPSEAWKRHDVHRQNANIMDRDAMRRFIEVTHERYADALGESLNQVEAFFTDEPQLGSADYWGGNGLPECLPAIQWCDEFPLAFSTKYAHDLVALLPSLFLNVGNKTSYYRYQIYDVQSDLIARNYFEQIQDWCHTHQIASTGHLLLEESLLFHLMFTGSACKNFRYMDLPGVDLLGAPAYHTMPGWSFEAFPEDYSCKLASSIAHLSDKHGVFTESFAVSKNATLRQILGVAAWQFAGGVTHFTTYTIQQELSAEDYAKFSDFVGRMATLCRRGKHVADVAILIPEASVWATYTPVTGGTFARYQECNPEALMIDSVFRDTCFAFSRRQRDFDIVDEAFLHTATIENGQLCIGDEKFSVLVVPESRMISSKTMDKIEAFTASGGGVAWVGTLPEQTSEVGFDPQITERVQKSIDLHLDTICHIEQQGVQNVSSRRSMEDIQVNRDKLDELVSWIETKNPADIDWNGPGGIRILRRDEPHRSIILVANPDKHEAVGTLSVSFSGESSIWNPETGEINPYGQVDKKTPISIHIPSESARFIVIER